MNTLKSIRQPATLLMTRVDRFIRQFDSTKEAADALRVSVSYLYRLRRGTQNNPPYHILKRLKLIRQTVVVFLDSNEQIVG